jgi:hypothetical protein
MDFENSLRTAELLAERQNARLGRCLFEMPIPLGGRYREWVLTFEIPGAPPGWQWVVLVSDSKSPEFFAAKLQRPNPDLIPRIRRRFLFGRREVMLPYGSRSL